MKPYDGPKFDYKLSWWEWCFPANLRGVSWRGVPQQLCDWYFDTLPQTNQALEKSVVNMFFFERWSILWGAIAFNFKVRVRLGTFTKREAPFEKLLELLRCVSSRVPALRQCRRTFSWNLTMIKCLLRLGWMWRCSDLCRVQSMGPDTWQQ